MKKILLSIFLCLPFLLSAQPYTIKHLSIREGLSNNHVVSIAQDKRGSLWFATEEGLNKFDGIRFLTYYKEETTGKQSITGNELNCLLDDPVDSILWIGTQRAGINAYNYANDSFITYRHNENNPKSLVTDDITKIIAASDGNLWICTYWKGVDYFDKQTGQFTHYNTETVPGFASNHIWSAIDGGNGLLYIGHVDRGFSILSIKDKTVKNFTHEPQNPNSLPGNEVTCVYKDKSGNIWIGTDRGVVLFNPEAESFIPFDDKTNCISHRVYDIHQLDDNRLWIAMEFGGIAVVDLSQQLFRSSDQIHALSIREGDDEYGLSNSSIRCLLQDSFGNVWAGSWGGGINFIKREPSLFSTYKYSPFPSTNNSLNSKIASGVCMDKAGNLWIGTDGGGINVFNKGRRIAIYNADNKKFRSNTVQAALCDSKGGLWFGLFYGGIAYYNPKSQSFRQIFSEDKSRTDVRSFHEDKQGNIWVGTSEGVYLIDCDSKTIKAHYNLENVQLKYTQNSFSIRFNIQNYALVNQVEYAYMLKGLENSWYTLTDPNNVTFRNLPPGKYQFQVKTRMRNQAWSDATTSLNIRIAPPLWLTWWAKSFYILLSLIILFSILYAYKKRLDAEALYQLEKQSHEHEQELNNERLRFYTNITHELRTPLTLILGPLEDIQKSDTLSTKDAQKISVIHQSAIRLLNLINQILEFRKTETQNKKLCVSRDNLVPLIREIGLKYKELNRKPAVDIRLVVEKEHMPIYFDKEIIQTILDNLISNALKYTEKGSISIGIRQVERAEVNYTEIRVSDTGYGIKPEALPHIFDRYYQEGGKHQASGTGIGLSLVKNLVALHEGEIRVESAPNQGSTFYVSLLTDNSYPQALHADSQEKESNVQHIEEAQVNQVSSSDKPILLVVEDNPDICDYIAESFSDHFEVKTAANGKLGKESALKEIPDIIVSDIIMPVMDGNEMCRELKKDVRTSHIPIILLTAKDSLRDKEEGYQVGADSYLTKPFSASLLHSRIENLLQSRRNLANHFSANAAISNKAAVITESLNKLDNEFIHKINQLIEERLSSDKIDISYLSDKMCMSNSTLYRKMKALTGLSTNEYVRKIRMKHAEQYLLEGKYNISEIAFKVGINNLFYFRQCFKEEFGYIPSEYLKRLKETGEK